MSGPTHCANSRAGPYPNDPREIAKAGIRIARRPFSNDEAVHERAGRVAMTKLDDISEAIGALRAEVKNLGTKLDRSDQMSADSQRRADEHRAAIHRRVDDLVGEVSEIKSDMSHVKADVTDAKTVTEDVKKWRLMGLGALGVVGIGGTAFGVLLAKPIEALAAFMRGG